MSSEKEVVPHIVLTFCPFLRNPSHKTVSFSVGRIGDLATHSPSIIPWQVRANPPRVSLLGSCHLETNCSYKKNPLFLQDLLRPRSPSDCSRRPSPCVTLLPLGKVTGEGKPNSSPEAYFLLLKCLNLGIYRSSKIKTELGFLPASVAELGETDGVWLLDGSSVVQSSHSPRDGGDPWQPCRVSPSLWDGCCDFPCSLRGDHLLVGLPGLVSARKSRGCSPGLAAGGIVKLEPQCGVMSELGPGVLTPKWFPKAADLNHIPGL